jgi:hypothetical protein
MDSDLLDRVDAAVGDGIEALVRAQHRRRLARAGGRRLSSRRRVSGQTVTRLCARETTSRS